MMVTIIVMIIFLHKIIDVMPDEPLKTAPQTLLPEYDNIGKG